ncbi:uncharacterized protein LOC111777245 isoform X3 [Cucurbita pepo subsp. pepo]|uniref:uncharacterized protein LOC111777245 isoform X3 n=1 Tax=Cucurbita pepo subsp. pepo TaxID=3664 RepID=UPI000C9D2E60|nr:uncharacterized protein LOC111777245 isoform X3 [Cucurbita pepo subsp. pepo]
MGPNSDQNQWIVQVFHVPFDVSFILNNLPSKASWPYDLRMVLLQSQSLAGWKKRTRESSTLWRREESHRPNREESRSWAWPRDSTLLSLVCPYE